MSHDKTFTPAGKTNSINFQYMTQFSIFWINNSLKNGHQSQLVKTVQSTLFTNCVRFNVFYSTINSSSQARHSLYHTSLSLNFTKNDSSKLSIFTLRTFLRLNQLKLIIYPIIVRQRLIINLIKRDNILVHKVRILEIFIQLNPESNT